MYPFKIKLKYSGKTVSNQNLVHDEIKSRFNSVNACCHAVQKLLSSCPLSKNLQNYNFAYVYVPACEITHTHTHTHTYIYIYIYAKHYLL
jgi:hypothetical protein